MLEYYTHFDVLDRLRSEEAIATAPLGLRNAEPLPSRLVISVAHDCELEPVREWLKSLFGPRYNSQEQKIILETPSQGPDRFLPVDIERLDQDEDENVELRLRPTLSKPKTIAYRTKFAPPLVSDLKDCPPVLTFHSFKGGMGRTTLALALAGALAERRRRVLYVDADFEAPGISSLLRHVMPAPRVAFADLLALAHTDPDPEAKTTINLVAERLADQDVDGITVFPCTRDLGLPEVLPDSLTFSRNRSAFFVGDLISWVGKEIGAELVIVDLRAGLSELVAALFLDPRLQHVLVTTLNGQSIDGTINLLHHMRTLDAKWYKATNERLSTLPTVIVNQVPSMQFMGDSGESGLTTDSLSILEAELNKFVKISQADAERPEDKNPFFDYAISPVIVENVPNVNILPRDLRTARKRLTGSLLAHVMLDTFGDYLPPKLEVAAPSAAPEDLAARRKKLETYAHSAIFAEGTTEAGIFPTQSLSNLVERHQRSLPTVVVLGDKGAGKSYTFMSLAASGTWKEFSTRIDPDARPGVDGLVLPVTTPQDLGEAARDKVREITQNLANQITGADPLNDQLIADAIETQKASGSGESSSAWRNFWLDLIAWRCGHRVSEAGAFDDFVAKLGSERRVVAIFDGIETTFAGLKGSVADRVAVEALLRAVPDWLAQLPDRRIASIVFIREDVARLALTTNFNQFENRYGAFALKWNWAEASALAFWIAKQAEAVSTDVEPTQLVEMDEELRGRTLEVLWGWKLGPENSREARSQEWVMSSLSDFNRRIKARDLVRFLYESSKRSKPDDSYYDQRLLSPRAMRDSIDPCSKERVVETGEENQELREVFEKIGQLPHSQRELPWLLDQAATRIGLEEVRTLEANGVFFRDGDEYYVPEIYRSGLGLFYSGGARRKVVTLMRRTPSQRT